MNLVSTCKFSQSHRMDGFSLLEVLIALLVLSFGLLGFAMLQTMNVRYAQSANYRSIATNLSYELFDQMRATRSDRNKYPSIASFAAGTMKVDPVSGCQPGTGQRDSAAMAALWKCQVVKSLGEQSSAVVTYKEGVASVTLTWPERTKEDASAFTVETRL